MEMIVDRPVEHQRGVCTSTEVVSASNEQSLHLRRLTGIIGFEHAIIEVLLRTTQVPHYFRSFMEAVKVHLSINADPPNDTCTPTDPPTFTIEVAVPYGTVRGLEINSVAVAQERTVFHERTGGSRHLEHHHAGIFVILEMAVPDNGSFAHDASDTL